MYLLILHYTILYYTILYTVYTIYTVERLSIARDEAGSDRLATLDAQIDKYQREQADIKARWELERAGTTTTTTTILT